MCTGTTRTCVFNMCAWCRHIRGRFECIHGGGEREMGGRRQPRVFHWYKKSLLTFLERRSIIERSALARCNTLIIRSRKDHGQGHRDNNTSHHTTPHHTTPHHTTPHHTTPHHTTHPTNQPTNQRRAARDMTRHHTTQNTKSLSLR